MRKTIKPSRAYGRVILDWQTVMMIIARGRHAVEAIHTLPKLPQEVTVNSVHNTPARLGFEFILQSEEPVEGWTDYMEEGVAIPLSPAGEDMRAKIVFNSRHFSEEE